ncbi:MAG TPA: FAD-dependent oxidoreductase [Thermoleophilaceae bacterium]|nr:FAD-dependent oxidoreductase [Thermoleophilaceae bacterium]
MGSNATHVIVGASLAGARAAAALREEGFDGRVVLVGDEPHRPYERPPLSKEYLRGEADREKVFVHEEAFYEAHEIELMTSTRVTGVGTRDSQVTLSDGERVAYDRLLLATGAEPRRLPVAGADLEGVLYLRDLDDSEAIRDRLGQGGRLVVVGAGWIGAEVAASAREKGLEVAIVEQGAVPLERALGREVGEIFAAVHRDHGVELLTGVGLEAFEGDASVETVRLSDGRRVDCDFVVVGIGVAPRTELADQAGLEVDNGIVVNERLESSVPGIYATGDVANARHPVYGRLRVEHWANALNQAPAAARNMLGADLPYDRVPYFFSDQYDVGMEYSGHASGADRVVFRGEPESGEFIAFWLRGGSVAAGMNVNTWGVTETIQSLVRSEQPVDVDVLTDPSVPLEDVGTARPSRGRPRGAVGKFLGQGLTFTKRFAQARFGKGEATDVSELAAGEAKILQVEGKKAAVHRDERGDLHAVSPVCTHMGCLVEWNGADRSWDCPCHGSRFDPDGRVLHGPAKKPLEEVHVTPAPKAAASTRDDA